MRRHKKGTIIIFFIYTLFLVWMVIFKFNFSMSNINPVRDVNWIPFHYDDVTPGDVPVLESLMNVVVFIPFGFLLSKIGVRMSFFTKLLVVVFLSLSFEFIQYVFSIGASDTTDIITNTIGGFIGIVIAVLGKSFREKNK